MCVFRGRWSIVFVCPSFPFGIEDRMWDVIVFVHDHYLSIYFLFTNTVDPRYLDFGYFGYLE